tara:strand:+ start:914 stop:1369 length:456 start_codon:yes stop_codon:yes gene_type:complete
MIISCKICKKKFNVDDSLIPKDGRQLQCSACGHKWFFKIETTEKPLKKDVVKNLSIKKINPKEKIPSDVDEIIAQAEKNKNKKTFSISKVKKNIPFFNLFLLFLITFVAFIIFIDTFKLQINNLMPGFNFLLENFYESLKDLFLFFKDLIR